jgi:hypothetical protein
MYFAVLEEIYNNVVPHLSAVLISCNHSTTRIISFTKNASNQRSVVSVYGPRNWVQEKKLRGIHLQISQKEGPKQKEARVLICWLLCFIFEIFY